MKVNLSRYKTALSIYQSLRKIEGKFKKQLLLGLYLRWKKFEISIEELSRANRTLKGDPEQDVHKKLSENSAKCLSNEHKSTWGCEIFQGEYNKIFFKIQDTDELIFCKFCLWTFAGSPLVARLFFQSCSVFRVSRFINHFTSHLHSEKNSSCREKVDQNSNLIFENSILLVAHLFHGSSSAISIFRESHWYIKTLQIELPSRVT